MINDGRVDEVIETLGLFDLVNGGDLDFTYGYADWQTPLREKNPDIILLNYFQSFIAQHLDKQSFGDSARLFPLFNENLREEWFAHKPDGERLNEFLYPQNYQLNQTSLAPRVGGWSLIDYIGYYLSHTVLPSGIWQGVHFDQADWGVNALLAEDRYGDPPPIDLDFDGIAEPKSVLYSETKKAYVNYFNKMQKILGNTRYLFGNGGHIAGNPSMLSYLNGWQREVASPYGIYENGDWDTNSGTGWYDLTKNYLLADLYARAPQINSLQFTGELLGVSKGTLTPNSLPDRLSELEPRDYQRMRLGLTTTLLGNGFFGYDFVDNTSLPVWFDEFAVNSDGEAEKSIEAKGYLGQPLNDGYEMDFNGETVFNVDLESIPDLSKVNFNGDFSVTSNPDEVISGSQSIVFSKDDPTVAQAVFESNPDHVVLLPGDTYHFYVDYKILEHNPENYSLFFGMGIIETQADYHNIKKFSSVYYVDVDGPGQTGTLRASVKITQPGAKAVISLQDTGKVIFDNMRVVKGSGGVWRRDFENGIILANPTPEIQTLSQNILKGSLNRTGIYRISGTQDSGVNNGLPVTGSISIGDADGIILLADNLDSPFPEEPGEIQLTGAMEDIMSLNWEASLGTVAGYHIRYGVDPGHLNQETVSGPIPELLLKFLDPGTTYYMQVRAFDHEANFSHYSNLVSFQTTGELVGNRPVIDLSGSISALVPGSHFFLSGDELSDHNESFSASPFPVNSGETYVEINGIRSPLTQVTPGYISGFVPWIISGEEALVSVIHGGVRSASYLIPVASANPVLLTWDGYYTQAIHSDYVTAVTVENPAGPGDYIKVVVSGLGLIEPFPISGHSPTSTIKLAHSHYLIMSDDIIIEPERLEPFGGNNGYFVLTFRIPDNVTANTATIQLNIDHQLSNTATIITE